MTRRLSTPIFVATLLVAVYACGDRVAAPVAPVTGVVTGTKGATGSVLDYDNYLPGQRRADYPSQGSGLVQCDAHPAASGSGDIGPNGGILAVGPHWLIVPPGALTQTVHITAVSPAGENIRVDFQPQGLQFKKPAGLVLDAHGCNIPEYYPPDVVYLNDAGEIVETIETVYSNYWHTAAAPIRHFSGYALAW